MNLKQIPSEIVPVDLVAGDQRRADYEAINPIKGVPALQLDDGTVLTQSMAILRYLDTIKSAPALLPSDPILCAKVEAAAMLIATDIHPVNNSKVVQRLKEMGHDQEDCIDWMNHWMRTGLQAFSALLPEDEIYCFGDTPGLADLCLVPQLYNAHRWGTDLSGLDHLLEIEKNCMRLEAFMNAHPQNQIDAIKE